MRRSSVCACVPAAHCQSAMVPAHGAPPGGTPTGARSLGGLTVDDEGDAAALPDTPEEWQEMRRLRRPSSGVSPISPAPLVSPSRESCQVVRREGLVAPVGRVVGDVIDRVPSDSASAHHDSESGRLERVATSAAIGRQRPARSTMDLTSQNRIRERVPPPGASTQSPPGPGAGARCGRRVQDMPMPPPLPRGLPGSAPLGMDSIVWQIGYMQARVSASSRCPGSRWHAPIVSLPRP